MKKDDTQNKHTHIYYIIDILYIYIHTGNRQNMYIVCTENYTIYADRNKLYTEIVYW